MLSSRWLSVSLCITSIVFGGFQIAESEEPASVLKSAFAERDITPEIGMERPGGYGKSYHTKLHDPCKVRAAVFDNGTDVTAVVSVDALLIRRQLVQSARKRIHEQTGIASGAILIHATHSHSSGPTGMIYPGEYDFASEQIQDLAYNKSSNANVGYVKHVEDQIVDSVVDAFNSREKSDVNFGIGHEGSVAFNRRFQMANGLTYTHPRPGNPDIVKPAGPIDPEVGVIGVWNSEGILKGCVVNFSCHATTNPPGISANYIYFIEQVLRGTFGDQAVLVFLAGASGDVTQVENVTPYAARPAVESARFVGGCVGAEVIKVLFREPKTDSVVVAHKSTELKIPRRLPSPQRVKKARELVAQEPSKIGASEWTFAKEVLLLDAKLKESPVADAEVQAIQIGPAILLTDPAEFFVELGLAIKQESDHPLTFPVSLANGCVGYVPTPQAFGQHGGGYETRLTSYSNLEINAGTKLVEAAVQFAKELQPQAMPTRPPAATFSGQGWTYGSVPPEPE
ncbi:hypothetical protein LOC67_10045 [Stieleria sp. JC731]|uniref:hypothetical protein n=1 Tax=Pirellulaceae TaxID=2691357 RepID=UPI001E407C94|nr:hypothetical protein [Stieleria sp. JC731]MCC9600908.1 hypothetical protein [Stieleria sp. JC731]